MHKVCFEIFSGSMIMFKVLIDRQQLVLEKMKMCDLGITALPTM